VQYRTILHIKGFLIQVTQLLPNLKIRFTQAQSANYTFTARNQKPLNHKKMKKKFLIANFALTLLMAFGMAAKNTEIPYNNTECTAGTAASPKKNAIVLAPTPYPVTKDSQWKYLDNGSSLDSESWTELAHNNSSWAEGFGT